MTPTPKAERQADGRKIKGTIHWLSAAHAVPVEVRLYDRLFKTEDPEDVPEGESFLINFNEKSEVILKNSFVEPSVAGSAAGTHFQFERQGYFVTDEIDSQPDALVFNRTVTLRDTWAKITDKAPTENGKTKKKNKGKSSSKNQPDRSRESILSSLRLASDKAAEAFEKYLDHDGLSLSDAEVLATDAKASSLVEAARNSGASAKSAASWVVNILPGELKGTEIESLPFGGQELAELISLVEDETISTSIGKKVLGEMIVSGTTPALIVEEKGLKQLNDAGAIAGIIRGVLEANPEKVDQYKSGKTGLIGFFVGATMKASQGAANPKMVKDLLAEQLDG